MSETKKIDIREYTPLEKYLDSIKDGNGTGGWG